ncbi:hypothetical protein BC643_3536 [Mangrovibacterium diazotrophicum]|uniref:Uncharacterized protein n=1 Tax=Mangrovibacterium diazotrophicum TaxID=1261403 RepID=A0A419VYS0_9BACT|nr:hypothetical protein BC643_3536 [Mangrovibacterium diazotrophicum]
MSVMQIMSIVVSVVVALFAIASYYEKKARSKE